MIITPQAIIGGITTVTATLSSNAVNQSMFTLAGAPTSAVDFTLTINSGVFISSSTTATAALNTGTFPAGSIVKLINNGTIIGKGGNGGNGVSSSSGTAGSIGGPAISLDTNVTITNASGFIYGGGGGGGGGGYGTINMIGNYNGAGGGGGQGGGAAGTNGGTVTTNPTAGTLTTIGSGGVSTGSPSGNGGDGGGPGAAGGAGVAGTIGSGGAGGAAGNAIALNGFTATFISGNDSTHVKGTIS